jgi:HK97 family phage portal protein
VSFLSWLGFSSAKTAEQPRAATQSLGGGATITNPQQLEEYLRGNGLGSHAGASITEQSALRVGVAYRCTRILASMVAGLPLDLYRRASETDRAPAVGVKLRDVLTVRPNMWQTPYQFRQHMTAQMVMHGHAAALKVKSVRYGLELIPVSAPRIRCVMSDDGQVFYELHAKSGAKRRLELGDVFFVCSFTADGLNGLGVLAAARESLAMALRGEEANAGLFKRGRIGGAALTMPAGRTLSQEAFDRLKQSIDDVYAGSENAHRIMLLEDGLDLSKGTFSADDLQFLESRKFTRDEVAAFFGVPPHMYGDTEKSTSFGSGIESQMRHFVNSTLMEYVHAWDGSIARDLIDPRDRAEIYARHDLRGLLRGDAQARGAYYTTMRANRAMSANEVRALEDLPPYPGGDEYDNPSIDVRQGNETAQPPSN